MTIGTFVVGTSVAMMTAMLLNRISTTSCSLGRYPPQEEEQEEEEEEKEENEPLSRPSVSREGAQGARDRLPAVPCNGYFFVIIKHKHKWQAISCYTHSKGQFRCCSF